ncbi:MAG: SH3 domain-containing protein [Anaerolineaceae bacterium]|nr:SH3 domain-containing protein [Anaerolineaceae bacterium]
MSITLVGILIIFNWLIGAKANSASQPTAIFLVIQAPTLTPIPAATFTPDIEATRQSLEASGGIYTGGFVQITGTDGDGLRLRSGPGLNQPLLFLGYDSEVFEVRDGPKEADNLVWWYLVATYDDARSGWAASNYLTVVASNQ